MGRYSYNQSITSYINNRLGNWRWREKRGIQCSSQASSKIWCDSQVRGWERRTTWTAEERCREGGLWRDQSRDGNEWDKLRDWAREIGTRECDWETWIWEDVPGTVQAYVRPNEERPNCIAIDIKWPGRES